MLHFGPVSSLFDLLTFAMLWWVLEAQTPAAQTLFQSGWFVEGLLSQTLVVHLIRTRGIPFVDSRAATPLVLTSLVVAAAGAAARQRSTCAAPAAAAGRLLCLARGLLLAYAVAVQWMKHLRRAARLALTHCAGSVRPTSLRVCADGCRTGSRRQ